MSVAAGRKRDFFGTVSGAYRVGPADTGLITLVPAGLPSRIRIQTIHVEVTVPAGAELWTFQDGAGIPLVPAVSAAAVAHFDFRFGPDGVPCAVGTAFVLNITGATGARGWITWEAYRVQGVPSDYSTLVIADQPVGYWRLGDREGYAQAVLSDGPAAYWRLNESAGTVAADTSGNGRVGTYINAPTLGVGGALADGTTAIACTQVGKHEVRVVDDATLRPPVFSLEAWFYQTDFDGDFEMLAAKTAASGAWNDGYGIYSIGQQIWFWVNNYSSARVGGVTFSLNAWHHVVGTFDGSTVRCYLDGVAIGTPLTVTLVASLQPFRIAAEGGLNPSYYWEGRIDEVALYPVVLSATAIANHYALRTSLITSVTPTVALDSSGNGYNGTVSGGVMFGEPGAVNGTAALFDGATGKVSLGTMPSPAACSYEAWIKTTDAPNQVPILTNYAGGTSGLYFGKGAGGKLFTYGNAGQAVFSNAAINTGAWMHVVATNDGATTRIYINGVFDNAGPQANQESSTKPWTIGTSTLNDHWPGSLNEVAFYATVLSPERIAQHYRAGLAR